MKLYEGLGQKRVLFKVYVYANSKTEAIKKIRAGDVEDHMTKVVPPYRGFQLSGGGREIVKEINEK